MEEWREVPGYPGYQVSDLGRVRSLDRWVLAANRDGPVWRLYRGRMLKQVKHRYMHVHLGRKKSRLVHCLVMLAFCGEPPAGQEVAHNDGDEANNALSNLRYDTPSGNNLDKVQHGTANQGEAHYRARLTADDVRAIRDSSLANTVLSGLYGVKRDTIQKIRTHRIWKHLDASA